MKQVPLTKGLFATVDDEDFEGLIRHKWCAKLCMGRLYAARTQRGKTIYMHRQITGITDPEIKVDHRDGNGLINTRDNLRAGTHAQNMMNRKMQKNNTTNLKGVTLCKELKVKKWKAAISLNGKRKTIGRFSTPEEAAKAYDAKARELHGEFCRTNF